MSDWSSDLSHCYSSASEERRALFISHGANIQMWLTQELNSDNPALNPLTFMSPHLWLVFFFFSASLSYALLRSLPSSSTVLMRDVPTTSVPLCSTFGSSPGGQSSVDMTFNLGFCLILPRDVGVCAWCSTLQQPWSSLHLPSFPQLAERLSSLRSYTPLHLTHFLLKHVVFFLLLQFTGGKRLGRHLLFQIQRLSTVLLFLPSANSFGWAAVVSKTAAPEFLI